MTARVLVAHHARQPGWRQPANSVIHTPATGDGSRAPHCGWPGRLVAMTADEAARLGAVSCTCCPRTDDTRSMP